MRIGQLITSFLQGKVNPTMTSTTSNPYADHAMVESRTGYYSVSPGVIQGTNRRGTKTVGGRVLRAANDLLPYKIRPIKSKRRYIRKGYTLGVELYTFRLVWRSHHWPKIKKTMQQLLIKNKSW
jgi:hypothetical protein